MQELLHGLKLRLSYLQFDDPLLSIALVLIAGVIGGELFARLKLPKVTGWIGTGILLRMMGMPGLEPENLPRYAPFMNFVLGYIAFTVGATLYIASLRNTGKRIGLLLLCELLITPTIVASVMLLFGPFLGDIDLKASILLAAIAIAGAPGTTVLVIQEARARGILTRTLIAAIGLIDMVAVGVFVFLSTFVLEDITWAESFGLVAYQFAATFLIGGFFSVLAVALTRTIVGPAFLGPIMVAVILGSWGAAVGAGASGILACTFAGIVVTNLRHDTVRSAEAYLHGVGGVLFATFFTLAGTKLDFSLVPAAASLVLLYFFARLIGKSTSAYTAMSLSGVTDNVRNYLGIALLPHGGVAVGLILLVPELPCSDEVKQTVTTVGLAALAINQLLGPSATRFALGRAGEDHKDRPRLLDFIQEQRIDTSLQQGTREEIIRHLSSLLYSTSKMKMKEEDFVGLVLARDAVATTCLGEGLMIPHAIISEGNEIKGVLGISSKGLHLDAPDGRPVHAVLLLATPENERIKHLEVLAAFATAITRDVNLREQLYHARSPAHAYDVIHADEAEDLNYFLEDAMEKYRDDKE